MLTEHPDTKKMAAVNTPPETTKIIGLTVEEISSQMAQRLQLHTHTNGVVVIAVQPGSNADRAGLQQGDVISEVNKKPIGNLNDYQSAISNLSDHHPALLLVYRQGIPILMTVKV